MRLKFVYASMAAVPVTLLAFSTGPPVKRTGIIDGGANCTACHNSFAPANSDARGSVKIQNLQPYVPGVAQNIRVTVSHPDASRWGFQLTARFVTGGGTLMAGSFTPANAETKVVCDTGTLTGGPGPCFGNQLQWIEHANAPRSSAGAGHTFEFQWTPPADENGDILFYFAGNAADGNGNNQGDRIYTSTARVSLSSEAACPMTVRPQIRSAVNAGTHSSAFSPNSMVEIYGANFQANRTRGVGAGDLIDNSFPRILSCIAVEINGTRVPVTYAQPDQINVQAPATLPTGPVTLVVLANAGKPNELRSDPATVTVAPLAPSFFTVGVTQVIAAQFAGTANLVDAAHPAKPGDLVTLYGTGFGATNPALQEGQIATGQSPLTAQATVSIGGTTLAASDVLYAGLSPQSISGLYQFNVRVPASAADGDLPVIITVNGISTQTGATITVKM